MSSKKYAAAIGLDIFFSLIAVHLFISVAQLSWGLLIQITGSNLWFISEIITFGLPLALISYVAVNEFYGTTVGKHVMEIESYGLKKLSKEFYHEAVDNMVSSIRIKRV